MLALGHFCNKVSRNDFDYEYVVFGKLLGNTFFLYNSIGSKEIETTKQTVCLVVNLVMVGDHDLLFNSTTAGRQL